MRVPLAGIQAVLQTWLTPVPERRAPLTEALGATLAEPLTAISALPRADTAAMDGFAVSGGGPSWRLRSEIRTAGARSVAALTSGEAVRIATGAPTPTGTTAVLRDEHVLTERVSGQWTLQRLPGTPQRDDTRVLGEYWLPGTELAGTGTRVDAAVASAALSAEAPIAAVRGPLRADIVMTGDEIRNAGALAPGQSRDSIGPILPEYLRACDIQFRKLWRLPDDHTLLRAWFDLPTDSELVITVGSTGHGAADRLRPVLRELGAHIIIDGVRIRPGGSQIVARLPDGRTLLALPGNPFAAIAALLTTGRALIDTLTARRPHPQRWGRLATTPTPHPDATHILPAHQLEGGVWRTHTAIGTPHLADLIGSQALALLPPSATRGTLTELIPLPY
ncbi:molybdopterin biosynthesis protein [Nocardia sp. SYP-A9097]|nr:molybdopterin biosynthesis protein [Nocardia sp. SYP-A9097]